MWGHLICHQEHRCMGQEPGGAGPYLQTVRSYCGLKPACDMVDLNFGRKWSWGYCVTPGESWGCPAPRQWQWTDENRLKLESGCHFFPVLLLKVDMAKSLSLANEKGREMTKCHFQGVAVCRVPHTFSCLVLTWRQVLGWHLRQLGPEGTTASRAFLPTEVNMLHSEKPMFVV
jgi:hypothetical protein